MGLSVIVLLPSARSSGSHSKRSGKHFEGNSTLHSQPNQYGSGTEGASDDGSGSDYETSSHSGDSTGSVSDEQHSRASIAPVTSTNRLGRATTEGATYVKSTRKSYVCTHDDCDKSYRKLSRLLEHERSHTGERPFVCSECGKSYLRESHLRAHTRSHLPASSRPFVCAHQTTVSNGHRSDLISAQRAGGEDLQASTSSTQMCGQRFWTIQHLRAHELAIHLGEKPYKCLSCPEAFAKHGALRAHIAESHSAPGTKPYQCQHPGCTRSFATNQKLKTHARVHDATRYACVHPNCSDANPNATAQFPTWTALQSHMRSAHPPKCPYPSCNGRTFASSKGLRGHIKTHRDQEIEESHLKRASNSSYDTLGLKRTHLDIEQTGETSEPPPKRRRGGEVGRDWPCPLDECNKAFKSKKAQQDHVRVSHEGLRRFPCPEDGCTMTFGYKHVMQRHLERHHRPQPNGVTSTSTTAPIPDQTSTSEVGNIISLLTGQDYYESQNPSKANAAHRSRVIACPWPDAFGATQFPGGNSKNQSAEPSAKCAFTFSRAYDLRRHLRSAHKLEVGPDEVSAWVSEHKR